MARVIPWKLPDVAGGSIGGYTPAGGDSDPEITEYFNFDNISLPGDIILRVNNAVAIGAGQTRELTPDLLDRGTIDGIETVNVLGASSMQVLIQSEVVDGVYTFKTDNLILDLNILTLAPSYSSGSIECTNSDSVSRNFQSLWAYEENKTNSLVLTFYVYNGNGEIIQTEEVTVI